MFDSRGAVNLGRQTPLEGPRADGQPASLWIPDAARPSRWAPSPSWWLGTAPVRSRTAEPTLGRAEPPEQVLGAHTAWTPPAPQEPAMSGDRPTPADITTPAGSPTPGNPSAWWAGLPGGPDLAAALGELDPATLTDYDLVDYLVAAERVKSWAEAAGYTAIAALATRRPPTSQYDAAVRISPADEEGPAAEVAVSEFTVDEIALALTLSTTAAQIRLRHALDLAIRLPQTLVALADGRIDGIRARAISDATQLLSTTTARAVQDRVLPTAADKTAAGFRRALTRAVLRVDPAAAAARHATAVANRKVVHYPEADGMATLALTTRAWQVLACYNTLDVDARTAKAAGDQRSMDALRADALTARVIGHCHHDHEADSSADSDADSSADSGADKPGKQQQTRQRAGSGRYLIQVVVPITTLLGLNDEPAHLTGHGPIPADTIRELAANSNSVWHRLLTDPATGRLLDYGDQTYHPPPDLRRYVDTRDQDCRLPVCAIPAHRCDFSHSVPFDQGGPTAESNGGPACRHHHRLSQEPDWHVDQDPDTATFTWTTPSGHTYRARPAQLHPPDPECDDPPDEDVPPF